MYTGTRVNSVKLTSRRIKVLFPALAWVTGLLLAGSDGPLMPYINGMGGLLFFGASVWLGKILPQIDEGKRPVEVGEKNVRPVSRKIQPGYGGKFGLV